ncbi:MAG: type pilus assembly protein PilC [Acidimicrobiaceae bacterium]|jgi:type IV pilus assembly protein PilC|nr:type pilus assembly protein PilC [Acidimicrobiaceae bacterium]MDQ1366604.1 type pilus assembly protein PilC [Acidimicrobiaceae bacterium]MDQ1398227.1 type pilus assembly protein PilC [Acidimicrobiaceae bacterium]MDQ1412191.1 type pilus assembly protein PilC [Acidimicrobiaceae bacterium]MDQ1417296.1 type pilus assembly protein PilC [Acidimicrobiaceae bacterium]
MPDTYAYKVKDHSGRMIEGSLEAESTALVANKLRQMGYVPIAIDKKQTTGVRREIHIPGRGKRIKLKDVSIFSRQFATMIDSGLTMLRSLQILGMQTESKPLAAVIGQIRQDVENGSSLSQAFAHHPKVFNKLYVAMVRSGESGGVLDEVLLQLADTIEKQVELRRKVRSAMTYPLVVLALVIVILTVMLVFIVPLFKGFYKSLNGQLPLMTRMLITTSNWVVKLFPLIIIAGGLLLFAFRRWIATENGRSRWDVFKLRVPVFGELVHKTALARFSRTFGVLLRSGVPILEALEITKETAGNTVVARGLEDVQAGVKMGEPIARPLEAHKVFPPMVTQMIAVGEESGALDTLLEKIATFYDQEVEATVNALTSLLEPLMIVVLGGAVGTMVIALYLPMFNVIKLIK